MTVCDTPDSSRTSTKITPPWSRIVSTHPASCTVCPMWLSRMSLQRSVLYMIHHPSFPENTRRGGRFFLNRAGKRGRSAKGSYEPLPLTPSPFKGGGNGCSRRRKRSLPLPETVFSGRMNGKRPGTCHSSGTSYRKPAVPPALNPAPDRIPLLPLLSCTLHAGTRAASVPRVLLP